MDRVQSFVLYHFKIIQGILLIIIIFYFNSFALTELDEAKTVALQNYKDYVGSCSGTQQNRIDFWLDPQDNSENAQLGKPVRLMELKSEKILSCTDYSKLDNFLSPLNAYVFPIKFNGKTKLLLIVSKPKGKDNYEIYEIGNAPTAHEMNAIERKWPMVREGGYIMCVNFQTSTYSFSIPKLSKNNLTIINSMDTTKKDRYSRCSTVKNTIGYLRTFLETK